MKFGTTCSNLRGTADGKQVGPYGGIHIVFFIILISYLCHYTS